jgi:hypothetical protein
LNPSSIILLGHLFPPSSKGSEGRLRSSDQVYISSFGFEGSKSPLMKAVSGSIRVMGGYKSNRNMVVIPQCFLGGLEHITFISSRLRKIHDIGCYEIREIDGRWGQSFSRLPWAAMIPVKDHDIVMMIARIKNVRISKVNPSLFIFLPMLTTADRHHLGEPIPGAGGWRPQARQLR